MSKRSPSILDDPFKIEVWSLLVGFIITTVILSMGLPNLLTRVVWFPSPFTTHDFMTYAMLGMMLVLSINMVGKFCILGAILVTNKLVALTKSREEVQGDEIDE